MTVLTEGNYIGDIVKYEADDRYSREVAVIGTAADLVKGTVLGQAVTGAYTVGDAAKLSGTGNGTITQSGTASDRYGDDVQAGIYTLTCTATASDGGTFQVKAPDGTVIGNATVGTAFTSSHINLTVNDGSTDWGLGAVITVTVTNTAEGKWYLHDPAGTDGRQVAAGILLQDAAAASADVEAVILVRHAKVETGKLVFKSGATAGEKSTALGQLEAKGIIAAKGA